MGAEFIQLRMRNKFRGPIRLFTLIHQFTASWRYAEPLPPMSLLPKPQVLVVLRQSRSWRRACKDGAAVEVDRDTVASRRICVVSFVHNGLGDGGSNGLLRGNHGRGRPEVL